MEPLVRLLEETPREKLLEEVAARLKAGLGYQQLLGALFLAGIRNVQPRPQVGFKFHAVLVVNSAHLASQASPPSQRWLPIFWALDAFKASQARDVQEGDWTMAAADEGALPPASKARQAFIEAMESWDVKAADAAVASLARSAGAAEVFELLFRYGARDFRNIGHKAIYVANAWRTLAAIGLQHAEPVMRSLAYALLAHGENDSPAKLDAEPDRPWRRHIEMAPKLRADWLEGKPDVGAVKEMLATLRRASWQDASAAALDAVNRGVSPRSIWDALFEASGELVIRQPGIVSLHAATTTNALHFAFRACASDELRRMILLQNAAYVSMFRDAARGRGELADRPIDGLEPQAPSAKGADAVGEIFSELGKDRLAGARKALGFLDAGGSPEALIDAARLLVFFKGNDAHDYKFSSAVLEDYYAIGDPNRSRFLAASLFLLRHSGEPDNRLVERTRAALGTLANV
jgi:hypothetical protein